MLTFLQLFAGVLMVGGAGAWFGMRLQPRLAGGVPTQAPPRPPEPRSSAPQDAELQDLKRQLEAARIASYSLRHAHEDLNREHDAAQAELRVLRQRAEDLDAKLRLSERMLATATEQRGEAVAAAIQAEERVQELKRELALAHRELGELRRQDAVRSYLPTLDPSRPLHSGRADEAPTLMLSPEEAEELRASRRPVSRAEESGVKAR